MGRRWGSYPTEVELVEPAAMSLAEARYWAAYELMVRGIEATLAMTRTVPIGAVDASPDGRDGSRYSGFAGYHTAHGFAYYTMDFLPFLRSIEGITSFQARAPFCPTYEVTLSVGRWDMEDAFSVLHGTGFEFTEGDEARLEEAVGTNRKRQIFAHDRWVGPTRAQRSRSPRIQGSEPASGRSDDAESDT
jgi:hypothetical protein